MKKILILTILMVLFVSMVFAQSETFTNSGSGYDSDPVVVSITTTGLPAGATITDTRITTSMGSYVPSWYTMHLTIGSTAYNEVGNLTDASYTDLNGLTPNGHTITITSEDTDDYSDTITMNLSVTIHYVLPGAPGAPSNPSPANAAVGVAPNGTLTWNFGADTDTYELWFGPAGNMTMVDSGAAGATGSYSYSNLLGLQAYNWRVIAQNSTREVTQGPLWSFTTQMVPANVPYNESFEAGNTDQTAIAGWLQQAVTGTNIWTANTSMTTYNRTPRTGSWNAYLRYGNTRWMFKAFHFEAGVAYEASLFARQDGATAANASIAIAYGTEATAAGMTNSILPATGIINGDYQYLNGVFTVPTTGTYYVGILGTINGTPWYISLDDITVDLAPTEAIFNISPNVASFNFGNVPIGGFAQQVFTISNTGGADLTLGSIGIDPVGTDFSIPDYAGIDWVVAPGANTQFTVRFEPQDVGAQNADLDIVFTREDYSIALSGSAYYPATLPFTEDWEAGQGNWNIANATQTNAWYIGEADPYDGSYSAYISNDGGVTNAYTITATSVVHLYTDIAFDAEMLEFPLSFMWKCQGESASYDYLQVFLVDPTVTPVAGTRLTTGQVGVNYNLQGTTWQQANITLPGTLSGSVKRLVFSWWNDSSMGTQPPINVDNISLTATPLPSGPPEAPTLASPADGATGLPKTGFNLSWTPAATGGFATYYAVYMSQDEANIFEDVFFETTATTLNPTTFAEGPSPAITFDYLDRWYWTVEAINDDGSALPDDPFWFDIEADPTIVVGPDTPWTEGFEGATFPPAGWTRNDADGDGQNWFLYAVDGTAHTGLQSAASASWTSTTGALSPDNWLITPPIALPATGEYLVEYYVGAQDPAYPDDHYGFYVSTTGTAPADFTLLFEETLEDGNWYYRSQNLAAYAGQTVHFAFRHFDSYDWFYMKIDDVTVRKVPEAPILSISPEAWDFGTLQVMNPGTPKSFLLSNVGTDTIDILAGDIQLTDDAEGNFVLVAENLPAALSGSTTYAFTVQFIPQSVGSKTATVTIQDNLTRVLHTIELSGEAIPEPIASVIALQGTVETQVNARLNWASIYGDPTQAGYVHWDDSVQRGNVGAGASPFHAVAKYGTEVTALATGKVLDGVMIHLAEEPQLITAVKVWTGTDADLAPVTLVHEETVSGLTVGWNYVALTTPVPITGTDAIYVGFYSTGMADVFPGSTDGLTGVNGRGNVVELGGAWNTLTGYGIAGNWLIHAHFEEAGPIMAGRRPVVLQNVAVNNVELTEEALRNSPIKARMNDNVERVIRGFNIYRDGLQINAEIVAAYTYLDEGLATGTYNYAAQAVHFSANGPISGTVPVTIDPPADPIALPFLEDWASGDYTTNMWTIGSDNWVMNAGFGNLAPSASFSWSPQVTDYSSALTSYEFDATGIANVQFSFDLYLNNYSTDAENTMTWEIWDGSSWNTLGSYSSLDDDLLWTRYAYDISAFASNRVFKIRFVAAGEDSYEINYWYIDNIHLAELPTTMDPITDLSIGIDGTNVVLEWTAVPNATWYMVYASEDPYGTFLPLGFIETAGAELPLALLPVNKAFVKVTAGAGPFPTMRNLAE